MSLFRLIPGNGFETVKALEHLSEGARKGDVIGITYVAFFRNRTYYHGFTGVARSEPELALGTLPLLEDDLKERIRNKY
jgi:hypothetical protein